MTDSPVVEPLRRVSGAAKPGEVLLSDAACASLDDDAVETGRARRWRAEGAPKGSRVHPLKDASEAMTSALREAG